MGRLIISGLVVWFLLSGCNALNWPKPDGPREVTSKKLSIPGNKKAIGGELSSDAMTARELLALYESLYKAPAKEVSKHKDLAAAQYANGRNVDKGLEYVLILLISGNSSDMRTATRVMGEISPGKDLDEGDGYIALIALLNGLLNNKSQFEDKISSLESVLQKREQELVTLKDQLNALKNIDKNIHEREVGTAHDSR